MPMTGPTDDGAPRAGAGRAADDAALEAFFAAGRATAPAPSAGLMARIEADAARQERRAAPVAPPAAPSAAGRLRALWASLTAPLGGGLGVGGLALAAATGIWLGATGPEALLDLEDRLFAPVLVIDLGDDWAFLADL